MTPFLLPLSTIIFFVLLSSSFFFYLFRLPSNHLCKSAMSSQEYVGKSLKILFFPFMSQGHMLPMVYIAKIFASRGVKSIILTTPANASLIEPYVDHAKIQLHIIPFPSYPGLPKGCENASYLTTTDPEALFNFSEAVALMRQPFDSLLGELSPDCVVTDIFFPWTLDVATQHGIPRLMFHGTSYFSCCVFHSLDKYKPLDNLPADADSFSIPGLPHEIRMLVSQIDRSRHRDPRRAEAIAKIRDSEEKSYGVVMNSFYELEPDYVRYYRDVAGRKAWHIGPVSSCNVRESDASIMNWLDGNSPDSVVYVCFGSMSEFSKNHIHEMAIGLEASGHPFVWVVRMKGEDTLPEGFEERTKGRCVVIRGWAPQVSILNHEAIGCFVTHCGWNSSLEAISAGVPMVTWPLFAEQFFNERLIVDVLKIGVGVGVKQYSRSVEEREVIGAEKIENAVNEVMGSGEEAVERRRKAKELGEKARKAVEKGGSSDVDIGNLIQELIDRRST